jgi:hypothetical protein
MLTCKKTEFQKLYKNKIKPPNLSTNILCAQKGTEHIETVKGSQLWRVTLERAKDFPVFVFIKF